MQLQNKATAAESVRKIVKKLRYQYYPKTTKKENKLTEHTFSQYIKDARK